MGTTIGHYLVESLISSGGFGVVYRVTRDGKPFALKLPLTEDAFEYLADLRIIEQRITREVVSLMTLKHPNIVRIHAFDRWPEAETGALYLVMDFVPGLPLLQWRNEASPTVRDVVLAFHALALALDEMHRLGVVHRDLKSSNVLVAPETDPCFPSRWRPVIVDFGLARPAFTHDVTREHALLGTEGLWAPEQLQVALQLPDEKGQPVDPRSRFSAASDLHALGLLFYEALTGRRAFTRRDGRLAAVLAVPLAPSALASSLPGFLDAPVMRLLAKDPAARHPNGAALADELEALLSREDRAWDQPVSPVEASTDTALQAVTADGRRKPTTATQPLFVPSSFIAAPVVQPLFARVSDAGAALRTTVQSRTLEVSRPHPGPPVAKPARPGRGRWQRTLRMVGAAAVALAFGGAGGVAIHRIAFAPSGDIVATPTARAESMPQPSARAPAGPARGNRPVAAATVQPAPGPVAQAVRAQPATVRQPTNPTAGIQRGPTFARVEVLGRVRSGGIEATLLDPVRNGAGILLPARTVLVGTTSELTDRTGFQLTFDRARLPTGAVVPVRADAQAAHAAGERRPLKPGAAPLRLELLAAFGPSAGH